MPEPAAFPCLTSTAEMKLASSRTIKLPWALTALKRSIIPNMACCLLCNMLLRWRKARRQPSRSLLTSSMKFETTGGETLSGLLLSLKQNCLRSGGWEIESCLQHTDFCWSDFCWLTTIQQPWGIGFPLRAGSAPSAGNGPLQDDKC